MDWKAKAEKLRFVDGLSWSALAIAMQSDFPDLSLSQVREKARDHCRSLEQYKHKSGKPVLIFSDIHAPFDLRRFPDFLKSVYDRFGCGRVVCLGDIVDHHAISRHSKEACAWGAYDELDKAIDRLKIYSLMFPEVDYVVGNHDIRPELLAKDMGIGTRYFKSFNEILELPDTWVCHGDELIVDDVLYCHGINCVGKNGAINKAIAERMSVCIGHSHGFGGVAFSSNKRDTIFGLNVGCGIDEDKYAFAYGRHTKHRSTIGCGVVFGSDNAIFIPMSKSHE